MIVERKRNDYVTVRTFLVGARTGFFFRKIFCSAHRNLEDFSKLWISAKSRKNGKPLNRIFMFSFLFAFLEKEKKRIISHTFLGLEFVVLFSTLFNTTQRPCFEVFWRRSTLVSRVSKNQNLQSIPIFSVLKSVAYKMGIRPKEYQNIGISDTSPFLLWTVLHTV